MITHNLTTPFFSLFYILMIVILNVLSESNGALTLVCLSHLMTAPSSSASVTSRKRRAKESSLIPAAKRKRK